MKNSDSEKEINIYDRQMISQIPYESIEPKTRDAGSSGVFILIVIVAIIVLTILIISYTGDDNNGTYELNYDNEHISGLGSWLLSPIKEYDGWIYYGVYDEGLYKVRPNGQDKTFLTDKYPYFLEIYEDRIYYAVFKYKDTFIHSIYSCDLEGSNEIYLCNKGIDFYDNSGLHIIDEWLYYTPKPYYLNKIKTDGTGIITLEEELRVEEFTIKDEWIYFLVYNYEKFSETHQYLLDLYRMKFDGTSKEKLNTEGCRIIDFKDDWIYYVDENRTSIFRLKFGGSGKQKLADCDMSYNGLFFVVDDWVYYEDLSEDSGIYKVKTDGSESVRITEDAFDVSAFNIYDDWLIYIRPPITYPTEEPAITYMIRVSDSYDTDEVIEKIISDKFPDTEIHKFE